MKDFIQQLLNAKKAVAQIRAGEWVPNYDENGNCHLSASRGNLRLWIGGGVWCCDIEDRNHCYFGPIWRHYVWWAAARKLRNEADRKCRSVPVL